MNMASCLLPPTRPTEKPRGKGRTELTEREREVLMGVAQGERSKEIAKRLRITERTVGAYIASIYDKLERRLTRLSRCGCP